MTGCVEIAALLPLVEVARLLEPALSVRLLEEMTGRYEEYPAFAGRTLGLEVALLGIPSPRIEGGADDAYHLIVDTEDPAFEVWGNVDLSTHLLGVVRRAGLRAKACKPS